MFILTAEEIWELDILGNLTLGFDKFDWTQFDLIKSIVADDYKLKFVVKSIHFNLKAMISYVRLI